MKLRIAAAALLVAIAICISIQPIRAAQPLTDLTFWRAMKDVDRIPLEKAYPGLIRMGFTVKANLVKIHNSAKNDAWIYNMETKKCVRIDYLQKTFSEGTFDQLKEYYARRDVNARDLLEKESAHFEGMEPKVRDEMAEIIKQKLSLLGLGAHSIKTEKSELEGIMILGLEGKPLNIKMSGERIETVWIAKEIEAPKAWRQFLDMMAKINPMDWKTEASVDGFVIRSEFYYGGRAKTWELQSIMPGEASLDDFLIPASFLWAEFPKNP